MTYKMYNPNSKAIEPCSEFWYRKEMLKKSFTIKNELYNEWKNTNYKDSALEQNFIMWLNSFHYWFSLLYNEMIDNGCNKLQVNYQFKQILGRGIDEL